MKFTKRLATTFMAAAVMTAAVPAYSSAIEVSTDLSFENTVAASASKNCRDVEEAAVYVRECLRERKPYFVFSLPVSFDYKKDFSEVMLKAVEETYNSDEGDYIIYDVNKVNCAGDCDGKYYYYKLTVNYFTNTEQEKYVSERVDEIIDSLDIEKLDDYGKISAIYEYIINNVEYDYSEEDVRKEKRSAYGALYNGQAVCQGFSLLFYRLAKEAGLHCRIISGMDNQGGHAWNIISIDGLYYLCDSTWDINSDEISDCKYFMKGTEDFDSWDVERKHIASGEDEDKFILPDYTSDEFLEEYPISEYAFDINNKKAGYVLGDVDADGAINSVDASKILEAYTNLSVLGISRLSAAQELVADVNEDDVIDASDASAVLAYYSFISTGGDDSLEDFIKKVN